MDVQVNDTVTIAESELYYRYSRSGGPGGQHVNRTETRVELLFNVAASPSLTEEQRQRLLTRLHGQIDSDGVLHIVSSVTRSQLANRADAQARFRALLHDALKPRRRRLATQPSVRSRERRMDEKRARSEIKQTRRFPGEEG